MGGSGPVRPICLATARKRSGWVISEVSELTSDPITPRMTSVRSVQPLKLAAIRHTSTGPSAIARTTPFTLSGLDPRSRLCCNLRAWTFRSAETSSANIRGQTSFSSSGSSQDRSSAFVRQGAEAVGLGVARASAATLHTMKIGSSKHRLLPHTASAAIFLTLASGRHLA